MPLPWGLVSASGTPDLTILNFTILKNSKVNGRCQRRRSQLPFLCYLLYQVLSQNFPDRQFRLLLSRQKLLCRTNQTNGLLNPRRVK